MPIINIAHKTYSDVELRKIISPLLSTSSTNYAILRPDSYIWKIKSLDFIISLIRTHAKSNNLAIFTFPKSKNVQILTKSSSPSRIIDHYSDSILEKCEALCPRLNNNMTNISISINKSYRDTLTRLHKADPIKVGILCEKILIGSYLGIEPDTKLMETLCRSVQNILGVPDVVDKITCGVTISTNVVPTCMPELKDTTISGKYDLLLDKTLVEIKVSSDRRSNYKHILQLLIYVHILRSSGKVIERACVVNMLTGYVMMIDLPRY